MEKQEIALAAAAAAVGVVSLAAKRGNEGRAGRGNGPLGLGFVAGLFAALPTPIAAVLVLGAAVAVTVKVVSGKNSEDSTKSGGKSGESSGLNGLTVPSAHENGNGSTPIVVTPGGRRIPKLQSLEVVEPEDFGGAFSVDVARPMSPAAVDAGGVPQTPGQFFNAEEKF
eukprot:TRINITY_DN17810_c0_g1_i1.p1 TRINITY_DN17810_c0_g1~~TRINITY_DN17810_c0_g1_i1.p1  ORF type:complete len:169 (-),score=38.70 TRINITY_DN17810_c0_g1_i1:1303-1809(-)